MKGLGSPILHFSSERAQMLPVGKPLGCARRSGRDPVESDDGAEPLPRGGEVSSIPWVRFNVFGWVAHISC